MPKHTAFGEAVGTNGTVVVALARLSRPGWGGIRRSANVDELAAASGFGLGAVAMAMKYAVKNGYAEKAGSRTVQQTWIATKRADQLLAAEERGG